MFAFSNEIPDIVIGLFAGAVVFEDLVQGLQRQIAFIFAFGVAVGFSPFLRDEGVKDAGLDHLGFDLVAVLDQDHGEGTGIFQGVSGQLIEDLVVLRLLPFEFHVVGRIDGLQVGDEERKGGFAAAGVADAVEHLAVGFFNGFRSQFFKGHALGFFDDGFDIIAGGNSHAKAQCHYKGE